MAQALGLSILCGAAVFLLDWVDDSVRDTKGGAEARPQNTAPFFAAFAAFIYIILYLFILIFFYIY